MGHSHVTTLIFYIHFGANRRMWFALLAEGRCDGLQRSICARDCTPMVVLCSVMAPLSCYLVSNQCGLCSGADERKFNTFQQGLQVAGPRGHGRGREGGRNTRGRQGGRDTGRRGTSASPPFQERYVTLLSNRDSKPRCRTSALPSMLEP
jgi:hypothetical protein